MMSDVLVHIGLHKTASTFLQKNVFPYIDDSVTYYTYKEIQKDDENKLVIVSDECFTSSMLPKNSESTIRGHRELWMTRLKDHYPDAKILLVLRDKKTFTRSLYVQYIKGGGIHTFERWYDEIFDNDALDYDYLINLYLKNFKELLVLNFDLLKRDEKQFINTICKFINRPMPNYKHKIINKKLGNKSLMMVRILNNLFATPKNDRAFLFPHCMHPRFWKQAMHWKKDKINKKKLREVMWYGAQEKNNI